MTFSFIMISEQISNKILNNYKNSDTKKYNELLQNPQLLQRMVQQEMTYNNRNAPYVPPVNTYSPPVNSVPYPPTNDFVQPTPAQIQYIFHIFQILQGIGALNMDVKLDNYKQPDIAKLPDGTISLPDGSKITPLPDGKYALIKNS